MKTSRGPYLVFRNHDEVGDIVCYVLSCQRPLTSPNEQAEKHFHHPRRGEEHCLLLPQMLCWMTGSSRSLTARMVESKQLYLKPHSSSLQHVHFFPSFQFLHFCTLGNMHKEIQSVITLGNCLASPCYCQHFNTLLQTDKSQSPNSQQCHKCTLSFNLYILSIPYALKYSPLKHLC